MRQFDEAVTSTLPPENEPKIFIEKRRPGASNVIHGRRGRIDEPMAVSGVGSETRRTVLLVLHPSSELYSMAIDDPEVPVSARRASIGAFPPPVGTA